MEETHAALMNETYRRQRWIYDATRKYFLFGRDHLIRHLDAQPGDRVLEVACGTGRNLDIIGQRYPNARLFGFDISSEMLISARAKLGMRAVLAEGDATNFDGQTLFGEQAFERIVLSYSVSMIPNWQAAIHQAASQLAPGGVLAIADFGDLSGYPGFAKSGLRAWLAKFHVAPRHDLGSVLESVAQEHGARATTTNLYGGYAQYCVLSAQ